MPSSPYTRVRLLFVAGVAVVERGRVLAEKLLAALRGIDVPGIDRLVTGSAGVATYPGDASAADHLLRVAGRALYAAKHAGRDRVTLAAQKPEPAPAS